MDILALDLSKSGTGWARYVTGEARPSYGTWALGTSWTDRPGMMVELYKRLVETCAFGDPNVVFYESPLRGDQQSNENNNRNANSNAAIVEFFCRCKRIRCHEVNNRTWKAAQLAVAGRLTTDQWKAASLKASRDLGMTPKNDNEADALHILDFGCERETVTPPWRTGLTLFPHGAST